MKVISARARTGAVGLAGIAMVGGLVASAMPAGAAAVKAGRPAPMQTTQASNLRSAVKPASQQLQTLASQDGKCQVGDVCLYFFSSGLGFGSRYDTSHNDPNLINNRFISAGAGQHSIVTNNAEAVWNRDPHTSVVVCTDANVSGTCGTVGPNVLGDFTSTFSNNVESLIWADSAN